MDIAMNKRIKELRISHGYKSRQAFADALHVDMSVVKSWERENNPSLPQLNNLIAMCDLFECDLDHLIGRLEEETHSIKTACEVTGLSEAAVKRLRGSKSLIKKTFHREVSVKALSHLIESSGFVEFMTAYASFLDLLGKMKHTDPFYGLWTSYRQRADGRVVMSADDAVHHYMNKASMALNFICENAYNQKIKEDGIRPRSMDYEDLIAEIEATEQEINYLKGEKEYLEKKLLPRFTGEAPPDDNAMFEEKE